MSTTSYPELTANISKQIGVLRKGIPDTMTGFSALAQGSCVPGAVDEKTKELIALAIGITVRCNGCIACPVHDALRAGATRHEVLETIGVAILMVSRVPTFSAKRLKLRAPHRLFAMVGMVIFVAMLIGETWITVSLIGGEGSLSPPWFQAIHTRDPA